MNDTPQAPTLEYAGRLPAVPRRRPARKVALAILLTCVYAPYAWLLVMDYSWNDYRWFWIKLWPVLPGFMAMVLITPSSTVAAVAAAATMTAIVLGLLGVFVAERPSWLWLLLVAAALLVASALNSFAAYGAFYI